MIPLSISHKTRVAQTTNIALKTRSPLLLPGWVRRYYPTQSELFVPFPRTSLSKLFLKLIEYSNFGETKEFRGSYYRAIDSAAPRADVYTSLFYLMSLIQVPENRVEQCFSIVLSFNNNNNTINLSAITDFILPNDHSQQQQQQQSRPRIYSDPQNPNLFFFPASFGLGEEGMITRDNNDCIRLLLAVPRLRRMGFYLLVH